MSRSTVRAAVLALVSALLAGGAVFASPAQAKTTTQNVPAELVFNTGQNPSDPGNCVAVVMVKWKDVPGTISAKANYTWKGKPYSSKQKLAPFDDTYTFIATFTVNPGFHWIALSPTWSDGPRANTCDAPSAVQKSRYSQPASVDLTVEISPEQCKAAEKALEKARKSLDAARKERSKAKSKKAKSRAQAKVDKATKKRNEAKGKVVELC